MAEASSLTWLIALIAAALAVVFAIVGASFAVIVRPIRGVPTACRKSPRVKATSLHQLTVQGKDETAALASWSTSSWA